MTDMDILASCRISSPNDGSHDLHARCLSAADEIERLRAQLALAESHQLPLTLEQARDVVRGAFEVRPEMCGDDLVLIRAAEKAHGIEGPNVEVSGSAGTPAMSAPLPGSADGGTR